MITLFDHSFYFYFFRLVAVKEKGTIASRDRTISNTKQYRTKTLQRYCIFRWNRLVQLYSSFLFLLDLFFHFFPFFIFYFYLSSIILCFSLFLRYTDKRQKNQLTFVIGRWLFCFFMVDHIAFVWFIILHAFGYNHVKLFQVCDGRSIIFFCRYRFFLEKNFY